MEPARTFRRDPRQLAPCHPAHQETRRRAHRPQLSVSPARTGVTEHGNRPADLGFGVSGKAHQRITTATEAWQRYRRRDANVEVSTVAARIAARGLLASQTAWCASSMRCSACLYHCLVVQATFTD